MHAKRLSLIRRLTLLVGIAASLTVGAIVPRRAPAIDPEVAPIRFLQTEAKLQKAAVGNVWLLADELRLRDQLDRIPAIARSVTTIQNGLDEQIRQNRAAWEANRLRVAQLQQLKSSLKPEEVKRRRIDEQIEELRVQAAPPEKLGKQGEIRARLIDLTNAKDRLTLGILSAREIASRLPRAYEQLSKDREVRAALTELGPDHRLGPLGDGYESDVRALKGYEKYIFTDWVPLYEQSGRQRISGIVNEVVPVTFTWRGSHDPTTLSTSMAEAAGLTIPPTSPTVELPVQRNRTVKARVLRLPSVRLGKHVLRDVEAYVLPPEAEDLGAQLGLDALGDRIAREQPDRLRLLITSE